MATLLSHRLTLQTTGSFCCHDITAELQQLVNGAGLENGQLVAAGLHTTTALVVNEAEDLHLRPGVPPEEPRNAHSHLIALMLGRQVLVQLRD